jgi:putative transposase
MLKEFVYLAVVLDRFSRKVIGWNLDRTLTARLPLTALENALKERKPAPGLVHHSDRGAQYSHAEYLRTLSMHGIVSSISRPGRPCDKDYASHCTSSIRCGTTLVASRRWDNLMPCAFRGGFSPGCSYKQSFLSL